MEDEENVEELLLVESELDDIQGMVTIIVVMNRESFTTLSSLDP